MFLSQFHLSATDFMQGIIQFYHAINGHLTMILILVLWLLIIFIYNFATFEPYHHRNVCSSVELNHMTPWMTSKKTRPIWATQELMNASRYSFLEQPSTVLQSSNEGFAERLEMSWTMIPALFILAMLHPSLQLLYVSSSMMMSFLGREYAFDESLHSSFLSPNYTIKVTGNQWYWTYEYGPLQPEVSKGFSFDSYTATSYEGLSLQKDRVFSTYPNGSVFSSNLLWENQIPFLIKVNKGVDFPISFHQVAEHFISTSTQHHMEYVEQWLSQLFGHRVLSVLQPICFPVGCTVKMLYTSSDVIHSWSVPSLGGKVDAIPGTVNQQVFLVKSIMVQWGQCYELCGSMHYNMPICVVAVPESVFQLWHAVWSKLGQ